MRMPGPNFRKAVYALSTAVIPVLVTLGVTGHAAAAWVGMGVAVVNTVLAYANVPGQEQ